MSDASNQYDIKLGMYLGELQLPFEESLAAARDLGAQYVWCGAHSDNRALFELSDTEIDEAARLVDAHGLKFFFIDPSISSPANNTQLAVHISVSSLALPIVTKKQPP